MNKKQTAPLVVVFPRGQLSPKDKESLTDAGIIAVEADDPKAVHQLHLALPLVNTQIQGDAVVLAALQSIAEQRPHSNANYINEAGKAAHSFIARLAKALEPKP